MPCYTERTVTVDLNVANEQLLVAALKALRYTVSGSLTSETGLRFATGGGLLVGTIRNGVVELAESRQFVVNEIKQAYAREAVKQAAKRFNWQTTEKAGEIRVNRRFG